ncbi:unnamed protein product [Menidia menidia]|uniref:(Atlantic silverside) hypothetical protein n=1 Tax=Menidia menidia TaxID=238744 RepID=A0A8S4BSY2_9TELE|nr:unnamed protein product [Menidia menidia]
MGFWQAGRVWGPYAAVLGIFLLLGGSLECSCRPQQLGCYLHLLLPAAAAALLLLATDQCFQRLVRHLLSADRRHAGSFLRSCGGRVLRAAGVGLLWLVCVLVDGDWYVCCMNDHSEQQEKLACTSAGWKSPSRAERQHLFHQQLLEQEELALRETLGKLARQRLAEEFQLQMGGGRWEQCFDVAERLVKAAVQPAASRGGGASEGEELPPPGPADAALLGSE